MTDSTGKISFSPSLISAQGLVPAFSRPHLSPRREIASTPVLTSSSSSSPTAMSYASAVAADRDKKQFDAFLMLGMFARDHADAQGQLSAGGISGFITMLEAAGMDTAPIKELVATVSGQSYEAFAAAENSNSRYNVSAFARDADLPARDTDTPRSGRPISNPSFDSARAIRISQTDNAAAGYCGRGTANVLRGLGVRGVVDANGTDWDENLSRDRNWVRLRGVSPQNAPVGAVLTYDSDLELGRRSRGTGGGRYGHVEVVAENNNGNRVYVSDAARRNAGGTVPDNYSGAFLYVGPGAPSSNLQIAQTINNPSRELSGPQLALS